MEIVVLTTLSINDTPPNIVINSAEIAVHFVPLSGRNEDDMKIFLLNFYVYFFFELISTFYFDDKN